MPHRFARGDTGFVPARSAENRPGKSAWFGPAALGIALVSWLIPFREVLAAAALACGGVSIATRGEYRIDWAAVTGIVLAIAHLYVALLLFAMNALP